MKVKELRTWLNEFGEKQKEQRDRSQVRRRSLASTDDLRLQSDSDIKRTHSDPEANPNSSHVDLSQGTERVELHALYPSDSWKAKLMKEYNAKYKFGIDLTIDDTEKGIETTIVQSNMLDEKSLALKTNPSADPTVATRDDSTSTISDIPHQTASWDTTLVNGGSWDNFPDPETCFDFSPSSSCDESDVIASDGMAYCKHLACPHGCYSRGKRNDGIEGFEDMGNLHFSLVREHSSILTNVEEADDTDDGISEPTQQTKPTSMHAANIFGSKTLTAGTLDFICSGGKIKRCQSIPGHNADLFADDETSSSLSRDSSSKPSIAPDALNSKMAQLLLDPHPLNVGIKHEAGYKLAHRSILRCKKIDPKDLEFLQPKGSLTMPGKSEPRVQSSVAKGIQTFGGTKKNIVQLRKEELQKHWAESKQAVHVKKVKWGVCQRTGTYKKKVVIDVQK